MEGWTISAAMHASLGRRKEQQDAAVVLDRGAYWLLAVMDGHGSEGARVAEFVREKLLAWHGPSTDDVILWKQHLQALVASLSDQLRQQDSIDCYLSGTTLTLVVVTSQNYLLVQLGDSGAVLLTKPQSTWEAHKLNRDHTCEASDELERVVAKGARVERALNSDGRPHGPLRIYKGTLPYPGIVITRSLGDTAASRLGVIDEPEISLFPLEPGLQALVLASDGVWDGLNLPQISALISENAQKSSENIVQAAFNELDRKCIDDNITAICVIFQPKLKKHA